MRFYQWRPMVPLPTVLAEQQCRPGCDKASAESAIETLPATETAAAPVRRQAELSVGQVLRLWLARHRHRQELAMMLASDLKDARLPAELVSREIRKWPWQAWHPQWRDLDEALLQGMAARQNGRERRARFLRGPRMRVLRLRPALPALGLLRATAVLRRRPPSQRDPY